MAAIAQIKDGKIVESASQNSLKKANGASDSMDKDTFLKLLVAEMKYQDPLEPTSNTEYIAQYAQFSQVEQVQNMSQSMDLMRASGLVGQEVYVKSEDSSGEVKYIQGKVDYVAYENGKAYVAINESLYALEDLDTVADAKYLAAYNKAQEFANSMNKLPVINAVTLSSEGKKIDELAKIYEEMDDYEKTFVAQDYVKALEKYVEKVKELRKLAGIDETETPDENTDEVNNEEGKDE